MILLNIGTTQNLLARKAEAGNTYQRYLDAPDADPAKKNDVIAALADIDKAVGAASCPSGGSSRRSCRGRA